MAYQKVTLQAQKRDRAGKGAARALRREGFVPAVIYGDKQAPISIALGMKELVRHTDSFGFFTHQFDITVDGQTITVLPRDVARHPVTDRPEHVDFLRVGKDTVLVVDVPLTFINEDKCPGIKRGGLLSVVRHELELKCKASAIPEEVVVDLEGYEIGDSIHISAVQLPDSAKPLTERDFTIAAITAPSALRGKEDAAATAAAATAAEGAAAPADAKKAEAKKDA